MELVFKFERDTKNALRYQEETNGGPPFVGTLYVKKYAQVVAAAPDTLRVTVEAVQS